MLLELEPLYQVFSYLPWVKEYPNRENTILQILIFWPCENHLLFKIEEESLHPKTQILLSCAGSPDCTCMYLFKGEWFMYEQSFYCSLNKAIVFSHHYCLRISILKFIMQTGNWEDLRWELETWVASWSVQVMISHRTQCVGEYRTNTLMSEIWIYNVYYRYTALSYLCI